MDDNFFNIPEYIPSYPQFSEDLDLTGYPAVPGAENKFWSPRTTKAEILLGVRVELEDAQDMTLTEFWERTASKESLSKIVHMILEDVGVKMGNIGKYWHKISPMKSAQQKGFL
jgi:hypothetical protein